MKKAVVFLFLCVAAAPAAAQTLSLEECRAAAVEHNRTLRNSRLDLDAASQTHREAFTNYFPQISASGGLFQAQHGLVQADFAVPQMGTLPVSMVKRGIIGSVTAVQPLFAGLKIVTGNKLARLGEEVGRLQLQQTEAEVRERTDACFWQVVSLRDNLSTLDAVERQLAEIRRRTLLLTSRAQSHWLKNLAPQLLERGVRIVRYTDLSEKQRRFLDGYFRNEIYPVLTPQAIDPGHPFPTISTTCLNFIIQLRNRDNESRFVRLKCPNNLSRFIFIPRNKEAKTYASLGFDPNVRGDDIVLLEDLMAQYLDLLFPGHTVVSSALFRITRNTDLEIEEDEADDLLEAVRDLVEQRRFGDVVRLEIAHKASRELVDFLARRLRLQPFQIYRIKGPMGFSEFMTLYNVDRPQLKTPGIQGHISRMFQEGDMFGHLRKRDVVLFHPYDSFKAVLDFIRRACEDPNVLAIKQTLYRAGNDSPIVRALIEARRRGKQVVAVVELKARFDEERNITWAEELEKEGVNVVYGFIGLKVHAKLCLVVRREAGHITRYVHIGTGNYNASTAKIYTDMGLITSNEDICADVTDLFNVMTGYADRDLYRKLLVSPQAMRGPLMEMIRREIELHKRYGNGEIIFKCNAGIIRALYRASMAGVRVRLQVRGICCLRPGLPGISENITVTSIVGRFLEHSRIYWFHANGEDIMYIGSADLMPRNLDQRIEVLTPILDPELRRKIREDILEVHLADNVQTWQLQADATYTRLKPSSKEAAVNAQERMIAQHISRDDI